MYCGRCGAKMNDTDSFCTSCGASAGNISYPNYGGQNDMQQAYYSQQNPYPAYKKSGSPKTGYIITGSGVLLSAILRAVLAITGKTSTSDAVTWAVNSILVICCVIGVICTVNYRKNEGESIIGGIIPHIVIGIIGLLVGKYLILVIIIAVVLLIFDLFSGAHFISIVLGGSSLASYNTPEINTTRTDSVYDKEAEIEERRRQVAEDIRRSTGADLSDIHVNSDGTRYSIGDGDWNKVSKDGQRYEDDEGNWNGFL